jgi:transcriptional regulator with XRE-family HTH domain
MPAQRPAPFHADFALFLGKTLCAARQSAKVSQSYVAERIGVSSAAVSNWERGVKVPSLAHLRAFAMAVKLPTWRLIQQAEVARSRPC